MKKNILFFLVLFSVDLGAQINEADFHKLQILSENYIVNQTSEKMIMDGKDFEKAWSHAEWSSDFVDIEGTSKPKPDQSTKFKMLWDQDFLYIFGLVQEKEIWATLKNRDDIIYHDNDFEVFLKPFDNAPYYYEIELNAYNTVLDLMMPKPYRYNGQAVLNWDVKNFRSAVYIEGTLNQTEDADRFWSVEMAIPFESLKVYGTDFNIRNGTRWKIDFSRVRWDVTIENGKYLKLKQPEHNWVWSPIGIIDMHLPERWGNMIFHENGKPIPAFSDQNDEIRKVAWNLHYLERIYENNNKKYTADLKELTDNIYKIPKDYSAEIVLNPFTKGYEAEVINHSSQKKVILNENGEIQQ